MIMMVQFEHIRCPLHRYTFSVRPIRTWVEQVCEGKVLNLFAGQTFLDVNEIRNDLNPDMPADYHTDALSFLRCWTGATFDTVLLDPSYAFRKSMEIYKGMVCSPFRQLKDEIPHVLSPGGLVITIGYHSVVMGRQRGFFTQRVQFFLMAARYMTLLPVLSAAHLNHHFLWKNPEGLLPYH